MNMIEIVSIIMLIFGILQIILFFKVWGMTNDVKKIKESYELRSSELYSLMDKLVYSMSKLNKPEEKKIESTMPTNRSAAKEEKKEEVEAKVEKLLPIVDGNSDEFKQRLRKWKVLKTKGFTEQAIREYIEYTKRDYDSAVKFINSI